MNIDKIINKYLINEALNSGFGVARIGGSIGEKNISDKSDLKGVVAPKDKAIYADKTAAEKEAKSFNSALSPGDKKYYGIKYVVAEIKDGKYTGK